MSVCDLPEDQDAVIADLERQVREAKASKERQAKADKIAELRAQLAELESS